MLTLLTVCTVLAVLGTAHGGAYVLTPWVAHPEDPKLVKISMGGAGAYGLNADGDVYHRALAAGSAWEKVGESKLKEISVGGTEVYGVNTNDEVFKKVGDGPFEKIEGNLMQVSVSQKDHAWGIRSDLSVHQMIGGHWTDVGGVLQMVSIGASGVWGVDDYGDIFNRHGTHGGHETRGNGWKPVPGKLAWISSGDNIVWGVNPEGEVMYRLGVSKSNPQGDKWIYVDGHLAHLEAFHGHLVGLDFDGVIYTAEATWDESAVPAVSAKHNILDEQICGEFNVDIQPWVKLPYMVIADAGAAGHYAIDKQGKIWRSIDGVNGWAQEPDYDAFFVYVSVGKDVIWALDAIGHTFTQAPGDSTWTRHIPPLNEVMVQISISEYDAVWATSLEQSIYRWVGDYWQRVFGRAKVASVGPSGVWVITHNDDIYYRLGTRGIEPCVGLGWHLIQGKSKMITSGHNIVFSINSVDNVFRRVGINDANPTGTHWVHVEGKLSQVDVYKNELWGHDINMEVWSMRFACEQVA